MAPKTVRKGEAPGAGGRRKQEGWQRGRYIFARLRSVPRHFAKTVSGFIGFSTKVVCVAPPRNQGGICSPDKSSVATSGCIWFPTRRPRSGSFALDIWGVSRNGVFSGKMGLRNSIFPEKTPLRDTPQISRGTEPELGAGLGNRVQPLVATRLLSGWQIPP